MSRLLVALLTLVLPAHGGHGRSHELQAARAVAEAETGGRAVRARRVFLNGTHVRNGLPGGVEVLVHMPGQKDGWRCLIDVDTLKMRRKEPIPNPPARVSGGG